MQIHSLVLSFSLLFLFNIHTLKSMETNHESLSIDDKLTIMHADLDVFSLPELLVKIIACCDSQTRNKLMRTNKYLQWYASTENSDVILLQFPLLLSSHDQVKYVTSSIKQDKIEILKNLLANGADPNKTTKLGSSPLYLAILKNSIKCAKFLIEETAIDINEGIDDDYACPLYIAAQENRIEIVQYLLKHNKVDTKKRFRDGFTACYIAAQRGYLDMVKLLLNHDGTLLNMSCINGSTPLYITAQEGHHETVKFLLAYTYIDVNLRFKRGFTPLYVAARNGHLKVVELLLKHKYIFINAADDDGSTALYVAAQNGHDKVVSCLLADPRIDVNQNFLGGYIPLYLAAQNGHTAVVKALLTHQDTVINHVAPNEATSLFVASQYGHDAVVKLLLAHPDINIYKKCMGETALDTALRKGHASIAQLLFAHKPISNGITLLHEVCKHGKLESVETLLALPCIAINALTNDGETPLDIALKQNHMDIVKLLITNYGLSGNYIRKNMGSI
jgi:ankyrin repeat protein